MLALGGIRRFARRVPLRLVCLGLGLAALTAHAVYLVWVFQGIGVDDAYISFRYADNLARGAGLTFNAGELVEGYSNFLWVMLLGPFALITDDLTLLAIVLGIGCMLGSVAVMERALVKLYGFRGVSATLVALLLVAASGYVAGWAGSGLESGLHGLLLIASWYRFCIEHGAGQRRPVSAVLLVALALVRPEGVFVALGGALLHVVLRVGSGDRILSRRVLLFPAIVLGGLLAYHSWRFYYYGPHLLPNAVRAKVGFTTDQIRRGLVYVRAEFLKPYLPLSFSLALLAFRRARLASWTGVALLGGHVAFVAVVGGDWSHGRFFAPFLPLAFTLFAATVGLLAARVPRGRARVWRTAIAAMVLALVGYAHWTFQVTSVEREQAFRRMFASKDLERIRIGKWLREASEPDTVVAVYAAGQIPYFSRRQTHDMLGLNDEYIANLETRELGGGRVGHEKFDVDYTVGTIRPDVLVDPHLVEGLLSHERVRAEYRPLTRFRHNSVYVRYTAHWAQD